MDTRIGIAVLPLHDGHVPSWLAKYMKKLAKAIVAVIVEEYGPNEVVRRLADPFWFQAFNNAIGMDWDSSGSTTVTLGILRQVFDENPELGLIVSGGKGPRATLPPKELPVKAETIGAPSALVEEAIRASRLAAKTDSSLLQDSYELYHHTVILSSEGDWAIIQQGMNTDSKFARRYHWLKPLPAIPTLEPHSSIASNKAEDIVIDLTSKKSVEARKTIIDLANQFPQKTLQEIYEAYRALKGIKSLTAWLPLKEKQASENRVVMESLRRIYAPQRTPPRHIKNILWKAYQAKPRSIEELLSIEGLGPSTIRSLALVSELIYGYPPSHKDPVDKPLDPFRYAYIAGGKDGIPFPFNPKLASRVISFLEDAIRMSRLGAKEKLQALRRLKNLIPKTYYELTSS